MSEFHLLRPWWLLALVPVALLYWRLLYSQKHQAGWHQWLPGHLSKVLVKSGSQPSLWPAHRFFVNFSSGNTGSLRAHLGTTTTTGLPA